MSTAKFLGATIVLGALSVLNWVNRYPAVSHRVAQGEAMPVWLIAGVTLLAPLMIVVGIAVIDSILHAKSGHPLTFVDACIRASLACTPLALYALVSIMEPAQLRTPPFGFFAMLLVTLSEDVSTLGQFLASGVSFAWLAFFLIYAKFSRFASRALVAFIAMVPIHATIVMGLELGIITRWID